MSAKKPEEEKAEARGISIPAWMWDAVDEKISSLPNRPAFTPSSYVARLVEIDLAEDLIGKYKDTKLTKSRVNSPEPNLDKLNAEGRAHLGKLAEGSQRRKRGAAQPPAQESKQE
jgi:hypothetical protein